MSKSSATGQRVSEAKSINGAANTTMAQQPRKSFGELRENIQASLSKKTPKQKSTQGPHSNSPDRGKKRDATGNVVSKQNAGPRQQREQQTKLSEEDEFLAEVQALGGSREDIMFLADVESDSEVEGQDEVEAIPEKKGKSDLKKGMANILKEIALAQGETLPESESDDEDQEGEDDAEAASESEVEAPKTVLSKQSSKAGLQVEPHAEWFGVNDALSKLNPETEASQDTVREVRTYAKGLLSEENEAYRKRSQSSSQSFYNTVIRSGTLSDKISALTLAVQESPIHNVKALETLLSLAGKRSRSQAVEVLRALKDLFAQGSLLPGDRRLFAFSSQPGLHAKFGKNPWKAGEPLPKGIERAHLVAWAYEDWLKEKYFEIIKILEVWCNDEIEFAKSKAVSYVYELLREKPEQESNLLRLLVNKLGDPVKKIASQASYLLMQLMTVHPAMKPIIVSSVESDFIFRPGQSLHGRYYATVTLNQTALSSKEEDLAVKLLSIYFGIFQDLINSSEDEAPTEEGTRSASREFRRRQARRKKPVTGQPQTEELRDKLYSALLTGVNRAYPYAGADNKIFAEHLDTLFKIAHSANFNTGIQAMLLIQQLSGAHQASNDRFYKVLYESLLDRRLIHASKQQLYLNLLHRSLKADVSTKRVKAFVKRILQVLALHEPPFICGAFYLLKDLDNTFPGLVGLTDHAEEADDDEEVFRDVDEDRAQTNTSNEESKSVRYDGHKRAPEYANADNSSAWELLPFLAHYHPSVTINADNYLQHKKLPGKADLTLHTLMHFLDRFVYKNAKLSEIRPRGASIMQPMVNDSRHGVLIAPTAAGKAQLPVTSEEFRSKQDKDVAADEVFFHQYFASLGKDVKTKTLKDKAVYDEDMVSDDEDAVWDAMMKSAPELEAAEDSEDDLSMSDLESAMASDSDEDAGGAAKVGSSDDEGVDVEPGIFDDDDDQEMDDGADDDDDVPDFAAVDSDEELSDEEEVEEPAEESKSSKNRAQGKKFKALPTFASVEDYAKMLEDDEDEDYGGK